MLFDQLRVFTVGIDVGGEFTAAHISYCFFTSSSLLDRTAGSSARHLDCIWA